MKSLIATIFIASALAGGMTAPKPQKITYCVPDTGKIGKGEIACPCTRLHPEWCDTEDPAPSCCRVYEGKTTACRCCPAHK